MDNLPLSGLPTGTTLENNATIVTVQTVGGTVVNQRVPKSLFFSQALTGALIAANNLSDIADKAIALANLGVHNLQYSAGTAAPTGTLGNIGDFAFNDNFEWYEKTAATTWILRVNGVTSAELTTATTGMLTQATADTRYAPLEGAAQSGLRYNYSSTTTFPSTSGEIRFNNAAIASVTQINIHESDRNSASNADVLAILGIGSRIQVALESNEEVYAWFRVTGAPTDNGTDRTIPVSVISSVGTFSAGEVSIGVIGGAGGGGGAVPVGSIYYQWATSIAASDPTAGFIKANNASVDLATTIYVSETDVETSNRATLLSQVTAGGILRIQKVSDGAYVDFTVATNTDNGAWRSIAGVFSAGSNSPLLSLAANDSVVLAWLPPTSSGGGATGLQYTYVNTAGTPAAGQIRSANISFVGLSTVSISATDAQTAAKSTADVLARLKVGAIIEIAASQANKVRGTITADYASGSNSFDWSGQIVSGVIANNTTVYLSIISDAPSVGGGGASGAGSQALASGTISGTSTTTQITITSTAPASGGVAPITYSWHGGTISGFPINSGSLLTGSLADLVNTGLTAGVTYFFRRVATDGLGNKVATDELSIATQAGSSVPAPLIPQMTSNSSPSPFVASSSSTYPGADPYLAFNKIKANTPWASANSTTNPEFLMIDLGTAYVISKVVLTGRNPNDTSYVQSPRDFTIEGSTDGASFNVLLSVTGSIFQAGGENTYSFSPGSYRFVKINITATQAGGAQYKSIEEMQVWGY